MLCGGGRHSLEPKYLTPLKNETLNSSVYSQSLKANEYFHQLQGKLRPFDGVKSK